MNIIQRELRAAAFDYKMARIWLKRANNGIDNRITRNEAFPLVNRSRARLMNVIKATNVIFGRA